MTEKLEALFSQKEFRREALDYYMSLSCDVIGVAMDEASREKYLERVVELGPLVEELDVKQHAGTLFLSTVSASKVLKCRRLVLTENKERFARISKCCLDLARIHEGDDEEVARLNEIIIRRLMMQREMLADAEGPTLAECVTAWYVFLLYV